MNSIREARYRVDDRARRVLLATGDAELWHIIPRKPAVREHGLEIIRERVRLGLT